VLFAGAEMKTPNHALELTAAPTVTTSSMATVSSPHLTLALGNGSTSGSKAISWRAESRHSSHIRCSQSTLASRDKTKLNKTARVLVPPRLLQFAICYSRSALLARLLNSLNSFTKRQAAEDAPARSPRLRETSTRSAIPGRLRFVECLRL
jgi:hypothetical protein